MEVPVVSGDVFRAIRTPAVTLPKATPVTSLSGNTMKSSPTNNTFNEGHRRHSSAASDKTKADATKTHRRRSSAASDIAKAAGIDIEAVSMSTSYVAPIQTR